MEEIIAAFTCYNRKEKTEKAIRSLVSGNPQCRFHFIVANDGSNDGTSEQLNSMKSEFHITVLEGNGGLFYGGGMRLALGYALDHCEADYLLLMNDDVIFYAGGIEKMVSQSRQQDSSVIVGATEDSRHQLSYSAVKYTSGVHYRKLSPAEYEETADTFNANCVLIPYPVFQRTGNMDSHYIHSLADFDYGLSIRRSGYRIHVSKEYAGLCENNGSEGTWGDRSLGRIQRIKLKENVKGAPFRQWFYFLNKNFGLGQAIKSSLTPYIRIMIGR